MTRVRTVDADVTVVGAGLAGLAAARAVAASGLSVVVIEARDRAGGRTSNHNLGGGRVVEAGGQWIGSTQSRVYQLATELGVDTFPGKAAEGKHVYIFDGRTRVFGGSLPPSPRLMFDFLQTMLGLRRLEKKVPPDAPWDAPDAASLDSISLKEWIHGRTRTRAGRELLSLFGGIQLGTDPGEVSLLYALSLFSSGGGFAQYLEADDHRMVGGSYRLSQRMAEELGDAVVLDSPVRRIDQTGNRVRVESPRVTALCGQVVVAVPPVLARDIDYAPDLPDEHRHLLDRFGHGGVVKAQAVYDRPFWRDDGWSGLAIAPQLLAPFAFDNTPHDGDPGILVTFLHPGRAAEYAGLGSDQRRKIVLGSFTAFFGPKAANPTQYLEMDWSAEQWTRGCVQYLTPGAVTSHGRLLRKPFGRIHFGSENGTLWIASMEGAILGGEAAANHAVDAARRAKAKTQD